MPCVQRHCVLVTCVGLSCQPDQVWEGTQIFIRVTHLDKSQPTVFWSRETFISRLYQLRSMYQGFIEGAFVHYLWVRCAGCITFADGCVQAAACSRH